MQDKNKVLNLLFNEGEGVCLGDSATAYRVISREQALDIPSAELVCVNPLDRVRDNAPPKKEWHSKTLPRRHDMNVTAFRNFVFEFDKNTLEEQTRILTSRDVPYSTLTFSGSKSLHAVIALTEPIETIEEYHRLFHLIRRVLWMTDQSCVNPSRLTRLAGSVRKDTGNEQTLLDLRRRISKHELGQWISRFKKHIEKMETQEAEEQWRRQEEIRRKQAAGKDGLLLLSESEVAFLNGDVGNTSSRHARLVAITHKLMEFGTPYDDAREIITKAFHALGIDRDSLEAEEIVDYVYS